MSDWWIPQRRQPSWSAYIVFVLNLTETYQTSSQFHLIRGQVTLSSFDYQSSQLTCTKKDASRHRCCEPVSITFQFEFASRLTHRAEWILKPCLRHEDRHLLHHPSSCADNLVPFYETSKSEQHFQLKIGIDRFLAIFGFQIDRNLPISKLNQGTPKRAVFINGIIELGGHWIDCPTVLPSLRFFDVIPRFPIIVNNSIFPNSIQGVSLDTINTPRIKSNQDYCDRANHCSFLNTTIFRFPTRARNTTIAPCFALCLLDDLNILLCDHQHFNSTYSHIYKISPSSRCRSSLLACWLDVRKLFNSRLRSFASLRKYVEILTQGEFEKQLNYQKHENKTHFPHTLPKPKLSINWRPINLLRSSPPLSKYTLTA